MSHLAPDSRSQDLLAPNRPVTLAIVVVATALVTIPAATGLGGLIPASWPGAPFAVAIAAAVGLAGALLVWIKLLVWAIAIAGVVRDDP